jgi:predicted NAD-dependent protein-ADP-ribosyltransferase YbiA (DUF1768 family)
MPTIRIFDVRNTPYARLSDNYRQRLHIEKFNYPTVTNYIYSNMLTTPYYRTIIQNARTISSCAGDEGCDNHNRSRAACKAANCTFTLETVGEQFSQLHMLEAADRRKDAIEMALNAKFSQHPEAAELLLATGDFSLIYASQGKWMGTGRDNDGENNYGKLLEAARDKLVGIRAQRIRLKDERGKEDNLYTTYVAYNSLKRLLQSGDDLNEYIGDNPTEILKKLKTKGLKIVQVPDQKFVVEEAKRRNYGAGPPGPGFISEEVYIALKKPDSLAVLVRGAGLEEIRVRQRGKVSGIVLEMYMDYLLRKGVDYKSLKPDQYPMARMQQLELLSTFGTNLVTLLERLESLYDQGMLSESLSKEIDKAVLALKIPSEKDVKEAQSMAAAVRISAVEVAKPDVASMVLSRKKVIIWPTKPPGDAAYSYEKLSPLDDSVPINIEGKVYPSVTYYILAREFGSCCADQKNGDYVSAKAYALLKDDGAGFAAIPDLERMLGHMGDKAYAEKLTNNARVALDHKFRRDRANQNILLATGKDQLKWDDRRDSILGTGGRDDRGFNFVGKELMRLRTSIREEREASGDIGDLGDMLTPKALDQVFHNKFLQGWFNMRVRDMCNVIMTMKDYLYSKYKEKVSITPDFVTTVLDHVYQPCSQVFAAAKEIESPVPRAFIFIVEDCKGFTTFIKTQSERDEVLGIMWRRLAIMIYYLMKYMKNSTSVNVGVVLKGVESLASIKRPCVKIILNDEENCILSALLNILRGIIKLDARYGQDLGVREVDFNAATTILLSVNSLAEQRAQQRKLGGIPASPTSPPVVAGIHEKKIIEIRNKLGGAPDHYSEEVIDEVIKEVKKAGAVPPDKQLELIALSVQSTKDVGPEPGGVMKRPIHKRPKLRRRAIDEESGEEAIDVLIEEDEETGEDIEIEDDDEDVPQEGPFLVPDPTIGAQISQALTDIGVKKVDEGLIFMVDEAISFVKSYPMSRKIKTNRINFFASQ